jgi:hypothetical protein
MSSKVVILIHGMRYPALEGLDTVISPVSLTPSFEKQQESKWHDMVPNDQRKHGWYLLHLKNRLCRQKTAPFHHVQSLIKQTSCEIGTVRREQVFAICRLMSTQLVKTCFQQIFWCLAKTADTF